jgi:hypothetical protein
MSNKRNDCFIKCSPIFVFTSLHGTKFPAEVSKILIDGYDKCYKHCINEFNPKKRKDDTIGGHK